MLALRFAGVHLECRGGGQLRRRRRRHAHGPVTEFGEKRNAQPEVAAGTLKTYTSIIFLHFYKNKKVHRRVFDEDFSITLYSVYLFRVSQGGCFVALSSSFFSPAWVRLRFRV